MLIWTKIRFVVLKLAPWWLNVGDIGPALKHYLTTYSCMLELVYAAQVRGGGLVQQTRYIEPLLVQCWSTVYDAGPTLNQQWLNVSCLLGHGLCKGGGGGDTGQVCSLGTCSVRYHGRGGRGSSQQSTTDHKPRLKHCTLYTFIFVLSESKRHIFIIVYVLSY